MSEDGALEKKSWLYATIVMTSFAFVMFVVQHFVVQLFDVTVEVTLFYIPAAAIIVFYLWRHFKLLH